MTAASAATRADQRVRFRPTLDQNWVAFGVFPLFLLFTFANSYAGLVERTLLLVILSAAVLCSWWQGVTLTHQALVVHNFNRRVIRWSDIQTISVEPWFGIVTVVVGENSGRRTRLRRADVS